MTVSLIATVKDAGPAIHWFVSAVGQQTHPPDEVVVVDGGSMDGTLEALRQAAGVRVISEPGANIARGRNLAIASAAGDIIAVTDADCWVAPDWLEHLLAKLDAGADVAAGFYRAVSSSFLQTCAAAVSVPELDEIGPGWMPSARSMAFRRSSYEAAGGYPEWLDIGEDMYLNHRLVEVGARFELAPAAIVYWPVRPTLTATWRQYQRYAEGDAIAGMYPQRHLLRFGTYVTAAVVARSGIRWLLAPLGVAGLGYASKPLRRAWRRLPAGSPERLAGVVVVPAMMAFIDAAKMWGYAGGLLKAPRRSRRRGERTSATRAP